MEKSLLLRTPLEIFTCPENTCIPTWMHHTRSTYGSYAGCMSESSQTIGLVLPASGQPKALLQDLASLPPLLLCSVSLSLWDACSASCCYFSSQRL